MAQLTNTDAFMINKEEYFNTAELAAFLLLKQSVIRKQEHMHLSSIRTCTVEWRRFGIKYWNKADAVQYKKKCIKLHGRSSISAGMMNNASSWLRQRDVKREHNIDPRKLKATTYKPLGDSMVYFLCADIKKLQKIT